MSAASCARPKPPGQQRSSRRRQRQTRLAGRRCADPWEARCDCPLRAARLPTCCARFDTAGIETSALVPRDGRPLFEVDFGKPSALILGSEGAGVAGRAASAGRSAHHDSDAAASRVSQRRRRRRARALRSFPTAQWPRVATVAQGFSPASTYVPIRRSLDRHTRSERRGHSPRRAHAARNLRRVRRPAGHPRARQAAARGDRARSPSLDHPVGASRHRQNNAREIDCEGHTRAIRRFQRCARGHQGNQGGHGGRRALAAADESPDDRLRRRDPQVQQIPAGCVPSAGRGRRHRPHRRDDGEPVVRSERCAPVALEGLHAARLEGRRDRRHPRSRACTTRNAALASSQSRSPMECCKRSPGSRTAMPGLR